jgi:hypothetical protein
MSWPNLRYYVGICLEGMGKATRSLSRYSQSSDWDLTLVHPEYEAEMLITRS